jgi:hypothetical protein
MAEIACPTPVSILPFIAYRDAHGRRQTSLEIGLLLRKKRKKKKIAVMSAGKAELSGDGTAQQTHTAADGEIRGKEGNIEPVSSDAR